ncbi:MAG: glycosyltransferase [Kiritimatiellia bacterium]|jgi:glycosyltransferase involved in cell wall biosynthesis|nr:glycosyltransferase [Kiritimatiellia bacterium]
MEPVNTPSNPEVSVVIPVFNEAECVAEVVEEVADELERSLGRAFEILVVDDGSSDQTAQIVLGLAERRATIRVLRHSRNVGQSFAFHTGFRNARGAVIVTLDGDGQNVPADIPAVVSALGPSCDCCCGYRAVRKDTIWKRLGSRLANGVRNAVLGETIRDTGCSVKAFKAEFVRELQPWNGMHRFFGSLVEMRGGRIGQVEVRHRSRRAGISKYSNWGRLKRTVFDLIAVRWLKSRSRVYGVEVLK